MNVFRVTLTRCQEVEITVPAEDEEDAVYLALSGEGRIVEAGEFYFENDFEASVSYEGDYSDCPEFKSFSARD